MRNVLFRLLLTFFCASMALPQSSKNEVDSVLIRKNMPSVYFEFERRGTDPPLFEHEKQVRIWLRLYNNTKWTISFCSFSVKSQYGDIGLVYDVKRSDTIGAGRSVSEKSMRGSNPNISTAIPQGYNTADTCTAYHLRSGNSVEISIPREHLGANLYIESEFWPEWENRDNILGTYPQSFVSFGNDELPKSER